jgi:transcriptional regulator
MERISNPTEFAETDVELSETEACFLIRRRLGKTQREDAEELGVSRFWFSMMEQGKAPHKTLVEYWSRYAG